MPDQPVNHAEIGTSDLPVTAAGTTRTRGLEVEHGLRIVIRRKTPLCITGTAFGRARTA
jgi:hypothetical protein